MSKHIVLATTGSYGDVFPFIAIARQLKARGHHAVITTSEIFRQTIESEGVEFCPIRPDGYINIEQAGQFIQLLAESQQVLDYGISYLTMPHLRATYDDLMQAAQDADLLVTHPLSCAASRVYASND
ncbi:glycosyltransferase [Cylindrospermum sp. FACHB-282]|uniref:glycosyltransferase n=1 Tax=Cylindrospermum sp. FACHB-282 TaxID=2692794 RepID=UPI001682FB79|nr:glycosyltransferase [Cylindrospermum sp. FACHB-282]MBD2387631.1 glycosyltransferase [Cylindrospermum sp. FACHB-282]